MSTPSAVLPLCYFPPVSWLAMAARHDTVAVEVWQSYRKQRYTSRSHIRITNKVMTLSVPVGRRNARGPICEKDVIYQEDWRGNHWRSIQFAYKSSPYFEYYEEKLKAFFKKEYKSLVELNMASTRFLLEGLGLETQAIETPSLIDTEDYDGDYRLSFDPARKVWPDWFKHESYMQVFEGFEKDLSGLDLLCNLGPEGRLLLNRSIFLEKSD
ncbi:MAG: WbqC family protein [Bacteroidia bacterium]